MTNSYVYNKFVHAALGWILLAPTNSSSRQDRVYKILKCAFDCGVRETDFPKHVQTYWHNIDKVWGKKVPQEKHSWMNDKTKAKAYSFTPTEANMVIESFLKIAVAVVKQKGRDETEYKWS